MVRKHTYGRQDAAWDRLSAATGPRHPPFTGTHHHGHSAYGHESGDDDGMHSHPHTHDGDSDHGSHDDAHAVLAAEAGAAGAPGGTSARYARHIRFEKGGMSVLNRADRRPVPAAAASAPGAPGAKLDGKYAGWGDFMKAAWHGPAGDRDRVRRVQAAANLGERVPADGGFLVAEELRSGLVYASLEHAICRPLATVIPATTLRTLIPVADDLTHASGVTLGGVEWFWVQEGVALEPSQGTYSRIGFEAHKIAAYMAGVPNELVEDSAALEAFFTASMPLSYAWAEDQAFIAGDGVGTPQGILSAPCQLQVTRQTSDEVTFTDVIKMIDRMLPQSLGKFVWLASPDVLIQLLEIYLAVGSPTTQAVAPPEWLKYSDLWGCWTLLGRPFFPTEHVSALGTTGDLVAVDMSFLVIADRMTMQMDSAASGAGFVADETEFRFRSRLDARCWLQNPVTPANSSETVSPIVILN